MTMKRALAGLLLAAVILGLTGCGSRDDQTDATPEPVATPEITPVPTPVPTAVPTVRIDDYEYYYITNSTLGASFQYPSHWINSPGRSTISYIEPVDPGLTPARLAVSSKSASTKTNDKALKDQLDYFLTLVSTQYTSYIAGEFKENVAVMGTSGIRQKYTARDTETGELITGYVLMCYVKSARKIFVLHFTAPSRRYDDLAPIIDIVRESMTTTI